MAYVNKDKRFKKLDLQFDYFALGIDILGLWKRMNFFFRDHSLYEVIKKNHELVNKENANKKIYVCALGPSLSSVDLNQIDGDTFVVNSFVKIADKYPKLVPTYYMMIDDAYARDENALSRLIEALNTYQSRGTKFILNSKANHVNRLKEFDLSKIYFMSTFRGEFHPSKDYDMSKIMPISGNVASFAVLLSILMGYKEIYLLGCDFNSFTTPKLLHCYKDDKNDVKTLSLAQDLLAYAHVAKYHEKLEELAERVGAKVYNATKGSLIDAYERIELPWA